jgi:hypothetical protein
VNDTDWAPTRHGGYRRRTRVAQKTVDPRGAGPEARAIASADVKGPEELGEARPEHSPDKGEVGGSNPSPRTKKFILKFGERLGLPSCPYVVRWRAETPWFSVRLHHWLAPDDDRAKHDHPWSFTTFVVKGGYIDSSPDGDEHLRAPAVRHRRATHQHTVFPDPGGAWTIIVTGPKVRSWGFWVKGKFVKMNKYFLTHGHHPCN